jgi:ergothioneine biosynthesis protein EgtC
MCRLAGYLGPERSLHDLWLAPPHGLVVQSYAPREMNGALLNADGFGMAWYTPAAEQPALYRSVLPLWGDENVARMSRHLVSGCAIANVRSATPGMSIQSANVSPFVRGRLALTHNGLVRDFRKRLLPHLMRTLPDDVLSSIEGNTDSEYLCALLAWRIGGDLASDVKSALVEIEVLLREARTPALLNFLITDGRTMIGVRHAIEAEAPSLYSRARDEGGVELASERFDDRGWSVVPPRSMVVIEGGAGRSEGW